MFVLALLSSAWKQLLIGAAESVFREHTSQKH